MTPATRQRGGGFDSASGLRPASAFVMIGCVLALVGAWVSRTVVSGGERRRPWTREESSPDPEYSIHDREGRPLALFVEQLGLVMSPNAMWQAHTPVYMAECLAEVLGVDAQALLAAMLPDAEDGIIEVDLDLDETQAHRIQRFADLGQLDGDDPGAGPVAGLWVQWNPARSAFRMHWAPEVTLSPAARKPHGCEENPLRWGRLLADGLAQCIEGELFSEHASSQELVERRAAVWELLMPATFAEVLEDFPAERAPELLALFDREAVAHHQMSVQRGRERFYPAGELALLGGWGFLDAAQAEGLVLAERGIEDSGSGSFERYRAMLPEEQRPSSTPTCARRWRGRSRSTGSSAPATSCSTARAGTRSSSGAPRATRSCATARCTSGRAPTTSNRPRPARARASPPRSTSRCRPTSGRCSTA